MSGKIIINEIFSNTGELFDNRLPLKHVLTGLYKLFHVTDLDFDMPTLKIILNNTIPYRLNRIIMFFLQNHEL